ncbi:sensor histidine kinase [Tissierella creatinophila]|uniref:Sensor histidine kinase NatK-like C-terminal domain-containing protein n=1 Tax=Tissierella creatinophila DSM 6911 TaxID=1123403 RepID=A0A1U7M6X5_TISCR|nr:GHKL domain-containing protein [Tissierella creatinophila]OLS03035.1 hypothetical protein TICRE_07310 [Tissierella creatinophila DSM 6911]
MYNPNTIISLIFTIIHAFIFIGLLSVFRKGKDYKLFDIIAIISIVIVSHILTFLGIATYIKVILISIMLFLITFLYKIRFYERILLVILYYFIIIVSELLVTLFLSNILYINLETIESTYIYSYLFLGIISEFLAIIIFSIVKRSFSLKKVILPRYLNYILILIILLSITSMLLLFNAALNTVSKNIQFILFIICLLILFINLSILIIYFSANNFYIGLQKKTTRKIYNKSYKKFIINAEKREDSLSKMWHDINNHIKTLEKMNDLESNKSIDYINALKNQIESIPNKINSGNKLIDIILNDKYLEAISHNIIFNIKVIAPPKLNMDDLDLSSILFNTIDNSIEACLNSNLENKYIYLQLYPDGNFLYYKIKNNYDESNSSFNKKLFLNKKEYIQKGYGLRIVRDIVEKYDGYIDIDKGDNEYSVTIVLPLRYLTF